MPILYARDGNNGFVVVPGLIGPRGPQGQGTSAYEAAKEAGYTGTEEEFNAALADIENKASKTEAQAMADTAETNAKAASDPKGSAAAAQKAAIAAAAEDATAKANTAEANAKAASDPKGSAATAKGEAIAAAEADATTKANAAETNAKNASDSKGSAAAVQTNLDSHVDNETRHITAEERTNWNSKAGKSSVVTATLLAANWTGDAAPYTYTLTVNGITATSNQEFIPGIGITADELAALQGLNTVDGGQAANTATILAFGTKPSIDIPIRVVLRGDG